jgi:hypothetical protein
MPFYLLTPPFTSWEEKSGWRSDDMCFSSVSWNLTYFVIFMFVQFFSILFNAFLLRFSMFFNVCDTRDTCCTLRGAATSTCQPRQLIGDRLMCLKRWVLNGHEQIMSTSWAEIKVWWKCFHLCVCLSGLGDPGTWFMFALSKLSKLFTRSAAPPFDDLGSLSVFFPWPILASSASSASSRCFGAARGDEPRGRPWDDGSSRSSDFAVHSFHSMVASKKKDFCWSKYCPSGKT